MHLSDESRVLADLRGRMRRRFPQVPPEVLDAAVTQSWKQYDGRPVRDFIPVLVERDVANRFRGSTSPAVDRSTTPTPRPSFTSGE